MKSRNVIIVLEKKEAESFERYLQKRLEILQVMSDGLLKLTEGMWKEIEEVESLLEKIRTELRPGRIKGFWEDQVRGSRTTETPTKDMGI
jgi:hypothetical protein